MHRTDALELLGLEPDADPASIRRRFAEMYSEYQVRLTNAPTSALQELYRSKLSNLSAARAELLGPEPIYQDLPSLGPSWTDTRPGPEPTVPRSTEAVTRGDTRERWPLRLVAGGSVVAVGLILASWYAAAGREEMSGPEPADITNDSIDEVVRRQVDSLSILTRRLEQGAIADSTIRPDVGGPTPPDVGGPSLSPREAADALFNRVMTAIEMGDSAAALAFQPMAVAAYERVGNIDLDARFHRAQLLLLSDARAAYAEATNILSQEPSHLLGLAVAADAALAGYGRYEEAAALRARFLIEFEAEYARGLPEYEGHEYVLGNWRVAFQGSGLIAEDFRGATAMPVGQLQRPPVGGVPCFRSLEQGYVIETSLSSTCGVTHPHHLTPSVVIVAEVTFVAGPSPTFFGLTFAQPDAVRADGRFEFIMKDDGEWYVARYSATEGMITVLPWQRASSAFGGSAETNRLAVEVNGQEASFFVNGVVVGRASLDRDLGGYVGLTAQSPGPDRPPSRVRFNYLRAEAIR